MNFAVDEILALYFAFILCGFCHQFPKRFGNGATRESNTDATAAILRDDVHAREVPDERPNALCGLRVEVSLSEY